MYKVKFKLVPMYIQDLFSINLTSYNLRVKGFSILRFNSITYGKHSLRYLGSVLWAKIPSYIRQSLTLKVFKKAVWGLDLGALVDCEGCEGCSVCST